MQLAANTVLHNPPAQVIPADPGLSAVPQMPDAPNGGFADAKSLECTGADFNLDLMPPNSVAATLAADCARSAQIEILDGPLRIAAATDKDGNWQGVLPLLFHDNTIKIQGAAGTIATGQVLNPEIDRYNRVILTAAAGSGMQLNAYENGAGFDGSGHVNIAAPRTPDTPLGGFLLSYLGAERQQIEIYTAPTSLGSVALQIEAEVTPESCGKDVDGTVQRVLGGVLRPPEPVQIAMPECAALGQSVILPLPPLDSSTNGKLAQK